MSTKIAQVGHSLPGLSISEAAEQLGVHPRTIRRMIAAGSLVGYRVSPRLIRVRAEDVAAACKPIPSAGS